MAATFAALEGRVNRAALKRLSNADALLAGLFVQGIFDAEYLEVDLGSGIESSSPALTLASADVPPNVGGAAVVVNGKTYKVVEPKPDGTGMTVLRLRAGV